MKAFKLLSISLNIDKVRGVHENKFSSLLRCFHTDRLDSYSASDSDNGSMGMNSNIIGFGQLK